MKSQSRTFKTCNIERKSNFSVTMRIKQSNLSDLSKSLEEMTIMQQRKKDLKSYNSNLFIK